MEKEKTTKKTINGAVYTVNEVKKSVTCYIESRGEKVYGYAKCGPRDEFDIERGKEIAAWRCEIAQRKRDLAITNDVIDTLHAIIENNEDSVYHHYMTRAQVSKHWDKFLKDACDEKKRQLEHIRFCKKELKKLIK